jgi:hypothetical protein
MTRTKLENYIKRSFLENEDNYVFKKIQVLQKNSLPANINLVNVLKRVEALIPAEFVEQLDVVYIGQFSVLNRKQVDATYFDGAIYVSNEQDSEDDLFSDIVHEIAHIVEESNSEFIYLDNDIEKEFLTKREKLLDILLSREYDVSAVDFYNSEYSKDLDLFLYKVVGYSKLTSLTNGLFISPYAATSLREYFANAFENYFCGESQTVKQISPKVHQKIVELIYA